MAVIRCKMCGGDLTLMEGLSVAECEYCGSRQTVPAADNEKKLTLFARAGRLRAACEFDKAAGIYETIVADFPEEPEAYWGLVLCKYGIEYVNDPGTGKKIPTCHRSSFDSVMDDGNFEQALENADAVALKVYRQEAKQIEQIRKGILEVSSSEKPYDIFICYKETDSNGDRTIDSLLAQDIYGALTGKGYRVFFSRISLEDKLGQAYEPYIFAALNSAKIMLAVGTCYEHYNAVWVKNEWSRYLKIIAQHQNRYLIPCYKGIDAYDIPREFAHLQGQDMGKVGSMQDLIRGIEKLIPKHRTTEEPKKIFFGGSKIDSLLDRGNMALEDGDWEQADRFFEEVLNNDSKNALAYIGKTMVQEQCFTLEAVLNKRIEALGKLHEETLQAKGKEIYIAEKVEHNSIPGYVTSEELKKLYDFNLKYSSVLQDAQRKYREEKQWWENHKYLSRAERFAEGKTAEYLKEQKNRFFSILENQVNRALEADEQTIERLRSAYEAHIVKADKRAEELYRAGSERLNRKIAKTRKRKRRLKALVAVVSVFLLLLAGLFICVRDPGTKYSVATFLMEHGRYYEACQILNYIPEYKDSNELLDECTYQLAWSLEKSGKYQQAINRFAMILDYKNSKTQIRSCHYEYACELQGAGEYASAILEFEEAGKWGDSVVRTQDCYYQIAVDQEEQGNLYQAAIAYYKAGNREKSMTLWHENVPYQTIDAGVYHTVGLKNDGTVLAAGKGLGPDKKYSRPSSQTQVHDWKDVVSIVAGDYHTLGLKKDGTVVATGSNEYGQCYVYDWEDIVCIAAGQRYSAGLKADGTVVYAGLDAEAAETWKDVVEIAGGRKLLLGLRTDHTTVSTKGDSISNVKSIAAGEHAVYLREDGSAVGLLNQKVDGKFKSVWAGGYLLMCIREDGSVTYTGTLPFTDKGKSFDNWSVLNEKDNVAFAANSLHAVVLKQDGTVKAFGNNTNTGMCNVQDWKDIKLPQ